MESLKSYQTVNTDTGEIKNKFKYLAGRPKQYRFDAKDGQFNINGSEKLGNSFTFQPLAWRIFTDNILGMGSKKWAEVFFVDDNNCVSALLFHGFSVENLYRLIEPLFYDDLSLADVVITATAERKENTKITPKGVYYIAEFSYVVADKEVTATLKEYAQDVQLYRMETLSEGAEIHVSHQFRFPENFSQERQLLEEETEA